MLEKKRREVRPERFAWGADEPVDTLIVIRYDEEAREVVELLLEEQQREEAEAAGLPTRD